MRCRGLEHGLCSPSDWARIPALQLAGCVTGNEFTETPRASVSRSSADGESYINNALLSPRHESTTEAYLKKVPEVTQLISEGAGMQTGAV